MKKKFVRLISAVLSAAMTLTAVPLSAFAEGEGHTHDGESNVITTPLDFREKTADENGDGWSWVYDTKTLTLDGVNIQATTDSMSVVTVPDGTEIVLNGNNTIVQTNTGDSDTYVLSAVNTNDVNCDGTMTISGDGVLNAENRSTDSMARSLGGSIILNGGIVNATGTVKTNSLEIHNDGVLNANATTASFEGVAVNVGGSITVDGNGSLTAVGCANESTLNSAILLTSNFGDKISVSENGSITVPEGNAARVGIYYSGNNGDGMDAEISGGKVTAYGAKYGIYKVNLIMSGTGSVYTTGGSYAIGQTVPTIDKDEFVVKGSTESKASESAVTGEVELKDGYYEIGGADAKTVVIKPDTSPRIILGKQTGIFKTEEFEIIEGMTEIKLKGTVYFDITLKNMSDEEFADARGYFGGDELDLSASIIKTDYGWVCMVCDTEFSLTYDTDNTLTIKCGDIVSNTVQVKSNANRFNKVTQGDNTNRTVFYTNTSQEEKDNYKLVSTYTVDSESISYNWYSTNSAYSADELGAAVSGSNGEFKLADNIPVGNYVLYCDITYSDGDSTETVTEKFTFTYKECAHENGYSDGKCTNCGALCDHSDIDINTGKCNECAHQFVATISTDGSAPTGYDTLADCLDSITADTGNYVKIYQDIGDASATATLDTIDVNHNVMIDLNGHKLNNIKLGVNKDVTLTLTGTAGSYVKQVYVRKGGSFIIDSVANVEFDTIFVEVGAGLAVNDGAKVTTASLTVKASVNDDGTTTTSVKLATGMKIGGLTYWRQDGSGLLKLGNLLDVTRQALQYDESGEYHDLYKEFVSKDLPVALTVVEHTDADHKYGSGTGRCEKCGKPCEHGGDINTDTGICSICGAVVSVALYTSADGNLSSYLDADGLDSILNEYNGSGTIKLFKDYSKPSAQYDLYGELTIDVNGRQFNIRSITPCKNGKLTIKNSGNPVMLGCNVYPTNDASYAGGTLIIDGDVVLDTSIYVYDSSTVILKDGTYTAGLYARDSKTLYDMLGEGKAFFKTDGTLFNASVKEISSSETLTVKDHSHTYTDGKCDCGYVCPHSDVDSKTGKCTECEYQYAAVIVKDGAVASVYEENEMGAAFKAADSDTNTGCTLKVYKNYTGSYTTLSGKFTLWIAEKANVGTLTVSGDITVTGSGKNNSIYGDFNVADGGKLTFDEKCGATGTVSVGAGTFDCYSTFAITLNINDASSNVILHGGAFKTICYNGGGDRANAEILTLLAENRMFMRTYGEPIDGSKTLLKDGFATTVIVISHEDHSYDSTTGKCTICGKRCGHTDVDSKTGVCSTCEYQLTVGVSGVGTAKYFDNIDDAFTAALSEVNSGCTLTLYKHCEITQSVEIGNTTVTVDVNGYSLGGEADISVNNGGVLYLKDSRKSTYYGCIDAPFSVNGGTLINGTADGGSSAADVLNLVINSAKCVEIYGGIFENVYIAHASGVALYGGRYNTICGEESNSTPVNDLLAKGYAFATLNSVTHLPESIVDGSAKTIGGNLTNVMVVAHEHRYNVETGKCPCGVCALAIFTETTQSSETYTFIESATQFKNIAKNEADGVLKLTGDVDCIVKGIIINGNKTIDMNGHTLNVSVGTEEISAVAVYGNVTFENSGSSRAVINATGVYSYGMVTVNGDIEFDTFATFEDGDALINAGVFKSIYVQGRSVIEILGSGKALASESGEILNASVQQIYRAGDNMFVTAHPKHTYDDHGNCACGYKCLHDGEGQVDEDSANKVCSECGAKIYAKVTTADGKVKYFDDITEGLRYADKAENKGCVFTLVTSGKINSGVTLSSGQFTIATATTNNNYVLGPYAGKITIDGADVIAEGDMFIRCKVNVKSGSLTLPEGSSTGFDSIAISGGTVTVSEGVNADSYVGADNLFVSEDATDAKLTIGGGTYGNVYLGQFKLKDVIASGVRVISYDNPTDPTAEKTATALLYSDIAEKNNFDSENGTVSYYLVTKCEHKNEDGSYAFNDGVCKYCNSEFAASVSYTDGGEKTELFGDIYDAFDKANEIGTATITLYKDITDSESKRDVTVTGNVTLELNGKTLGGRYGIARISVSDGGTLTVNGDGDMDTPIYVNENSKLVINGGGYFNSVSVKKGGNAEIGGGTIRGLSVRGNVKLSGGKFNDIEILNGNLESVLADGYAYKVDGGAWLSIAERAESVYSSVNNDNKPVNVEEAPIKSATLSTEINKLYRNSNANPTLKFNLTLANGSNLNDSYVSKRYGINSYVSGDIIYSSLSALVKDAKLSADEIIDKAGDSDAAEIYYVVTTGDGYEIKSNTVSIDLVDCDHSQVADPTADKETAGNITTPTYCEICESKFNAKITKGDDVRYYNDLDEAAKDAQKSENEGCTLYPLYNKNGYGGQLVITEGNFTLKYAVRTAFSRPIIINGKAKLTVTGRCAVTAFENQDAFIVRGGDVTFDGLATGSNVTINGGNVTMAANNINCLTIHGGNVSISSGGFAEIVTTVSDKVIADYIDHGFWVQDRGTKEWIDIYSLNKATASSTSGLTVRLCPMQIIKPIDTVYYTNGYYPGDIPSLQINAVPWYSGEVDANVAYQWIAIDENGNETEIEGATDRKLSLENLTTGRYYCRLTYSNATTAGVSMKSDVVTATITECEHSGGEATCTEKAKCEICGAEYGEPLGHDYVVIKVVEPDYRNEGYSVFECTRCKDSYIGNRVPVKPIPDVEEIAVEKTTYNEVDISWKNISGVDGYYVECYVGNQWKQIGFSTDGDRVAAKLSGLSAGLKYKVRIAAYAGSFTGKFRCFYVDTIPSPVWNINTVKATDETVRISWNRNTRADGYKVEWYIDNQWSAKTVTGNNNIAAVIDGLCAGTRYKVRVSAYKGDLYSPYTYGYIDTLPSKVTGITQTVTSSSFTLTWDKNESADGYTVQYYADGKWNEKTLTGNNKTTVTIGSLKGYKTYKVRIKAYKGELQSTFDDIYITTAPTKVSGLKVKSAVDSKAVVIWNADANADGYNVGYYIGGKWLEKTITDNKTAMAVLGGLTPYSTYKVRVRAYKDNLYGDYSYTTVTAVLSPVTDIKVVSAKSNSITVKWGKNASADGYKVEIYKGGKWVKKTLKGSTNATVTIGGLRAGSVYKVRIASYKGANTSAYTYANVNTAK